MMAHQEAAIATLNNGLVIQTPVVNPKKKRNLPGNPDPEAEVIALSPKTLMTTNRFVCEVCGKGFPRDQNLQLHRRGHNLPWKLKQRNGMEVRKRVYVCPEKTCVHHHASRALGDLTGIKKHFCRKHGEKKWRCEKCSKKYAVQSDWKAHSKTCGTREYRCDCGTVFSRRDSFITHRAFCDALAEETARMNAASHFNLAAASGGGGSLNYTFMAPQPNFSNLFKPFPPKDELETRLVNDTIDHHQLQKGSNSHHHPLWFMSQGDQINLNADDHINQQIALSSINPFYTNPQSVVSCSDHHPQQPEASNGYQMNWFLGGDTNKMCQASNGGEEALTCSSLPLMSTQNTTSTREEVFGSVSLPSIYSNQHLQASSSSAPIMSATALLQKAAQIGATTTKNDSVFLGGIKHGGESKYGAESGNSTTTNLVGSDVESTENVFSPMSSSNNNNNQLDMFFGGAVKRRRVMQREEDEFRHDYQQSEAEEDGGQTRDFLGVGIESICHPSPISGWI